MMRKFVSLIAAMVVLSLSVLAQDKPVTLTGVIVDKMCSARFLKAANPQEAAANSPTDCATKESCAKSGLGIFANGKYTLFNEEGTARALAALKKSTKEKGATFKVVGKYEGDKFALESISEVN